MAVRLEKPWQALTPEAVQQLPGQVGVYQLADADGNVVRIAYAGGLSLFGLRSELEAALGCADNFRVEVTTAYATRCKELLMVHYADYGQYPLLNTAAELRGLGRLSP